MSRVTPLLIILLLSLGAGFWYLVQAEQKAGRKPLEFIGAELRQFTAVITGKKPVPARPSPAQDNSDFTSGRSRFSQGVCRDDHDCKISGCSSEVCGSVETVTTCEYSESFPSAETHSCGCVDGVCGWQAR